MSSLVLVQQTVGGSFGVVGDLQERFGTAQHVVVRMSSLVLVQQPVGGCFGVIGDNTDVFENHTDVWLCRRWCWYNKRIMMNTWL